MCPFHLPMGAHASPYGCDCPFTCSQLDLPADDDEPWEARNKSTLSPIKETCERRTPTSAAAATQHFQAPHLVSYPADEDIGALWTAWRSEIVADGADHTGLDSGLWGECDEDLLAP